MPIYTKNRTKFTCCYQFILSEKLINNYTSATSIIIKRLVFNFTFWNDHKT